MRDKSNLGELSPHIFEERGGFPESSINNTPTLPGDLPSDLRYRGGAVPPPQAGPVQNLGETNSENNAQLFKALRRQGFFMTEPFTATTSAKLLRPMESRTYLVLQNIDTVGNLLFGFGNIPTANNSFKLVPSGSYEPWVIPINDIYVMSSAGSVNGYMIYARESS